MFGVGVHLEAESRYFRTWGHLRQSVFPTISLQLPLAQGCSAKAVAEVEVKVSGHLDTFFKTNIKALLFVMKYLDTRGGAS